MTLTPQHHVLVILCRPSEPIFIPKGEMKLVFDVLNNDFLAPQFRHARNELVQQFYNQNGNVLVPLKPIEFPDLTAVIAVKRDEAFSIFLPHHRRAAVSLLKIFMGAANYDEFLSCVVYARDRVNPMMFVYAYSVAVMHRSDTMGVLLPPLHNIFPDKFLDFSVLANAREWAGVLTAGEPHQLHTRITVFPKDYTASDLDVEHRLAYFREDIGINLHHWHWHLVYPFDGTLDIVKKDRRGELFYYMHRQIVARYNFERLCNRLGRSERLLDLRKKIPEGYFPKLYSTRMCRSWPSRSSNAKLSDVRREEQNWVFDIDDLERWKTQIIEAIHLKRVIDKEGRAVALTETEGIDILGNLVEASPLLSKNFDFYGNLHNNGHLVIGFCHDPDGRYEEPIGIMGDQATAMRDPVFYRWHSYIDYIFEMHKDTLQPYSLSELKREGIHVEEVSIYTQKERCKNILKTFWQERDLELSCGLDFTDKMPIYARVIQLQHMPFRYKIKVTNSTNRVCEGTVRIFLAPKFDEKGREMLFIDQKRLFVELDKFNFTFSRHPEMNVIERASEDSFVTVPEGPCFEEIEQMLKDGGKKKRYFSDNFCGCGWPEHMLIPKGSPEGFQAQIFVMISSADMDNQIDGDSCLKANSYCGVRDAKYPDRRAMGFPFDRRPLDKINTLKDFVALASNMAVQDVKIVFEDRTETPPYPTN